MAFIIIFGTGIYAIFTYIFLIFKNHWKHLSFLGINCLSYFINLVRLQKTSGDAVFLVGSFVGEATSEIQSALCTSSLIIHFYLFYRGGGTNFLLICAWNFYASDPPSRPRKLHVTKHEKDSVHLAWTPPESDGGAPIRRYIIEGKCEDDADFRHIGKVDGKTTNWDSIGLQKGKHYHFRVRAENPVGTSDDTADLDEIIYTGPATGK